MPVPAKSQILEGVWGGEFAGDPNIIEVYVGRLRNKVRASYNQASYLDERRKMMQRWADICDEEPGSVVAIKARRNVQA